MQFPNNSSLIANHPSLQSFALINPDTLFNPRPFAFSHVAEVRHYLRALHISGQGGQNSHGQLSTDFGHQVEQALQNITFVLKDRGATLADIAVLRIYVVEHNSNKHQLLIQAMQRLWQDQAFPACSLVPVNCLALTGMLIEIEATAYCL